MDNRLATLLHELIVEYIATAEPVGSVRLHEISTIEASPATLRILLRALEDEGYIEQTHTSSGRIPTDKGYRSYVNQLIWRDITQHRLNALASRYYRLQQANASSMKPATKLLADLTQTLAAGGLLGRGDVYEAGFSGLFGQPEGEQLETVREVTDIADGLDEHIEEFADEAREHVAVFIGSENPAYAAEHTSILARTVTLPSGEEMILMLIGPKRMPYSRHVPLLEAMATIMKQLV